MTTRQRAGLAALLAAAFLLRLLLILSLRDAPYFYEPIVDGAAYDAWGHRIATQSFWGDEAFYQDPLYPYFLGVFYKLFGRDLLAVRMVQAALATLGLWMLFEAARRKLGFPAAAAALALGAFMKSLAVFDTAILKDWMGVLAVEAALLAWSLEARWKWLAFGAALGLGTLARGNMLLVAAAVAVFLAVRRDFKPAAAVAAGACLCILPVTVRNAAVGGGFVLTTSQLGPNLYTGNNPENTTGRYRPPSFLEAGATEFEAKGFRAEAERRKGRPLTASEIDAYWRREALRYIASHPFTFASVTLKRLAMLVQSYEVPDDYDPGFMARFSWVLRLPLFTWGFAVLPLAAAGIYLAWTERARYAVPLLMLGAYAVSILFFFVFARYRLPLVPLLLLFAGHALAKGAQLVRWRMTAVPRTAAIVFAATLVLCFLPLPASVVGHRDFRTSHLNLGIYRHRQGRHAEAAAELEAAARLNPALGNDPAFLWTWGSSLEQTRAEDRAFELYSRATALDRASPEAPYKLGLIYLSRGMLPQAVEKLSDAVARDPSFAAAYLPLAEAELRLK
ncbi:MAG TPA: glycosyltransferase family 39 protein, partial [Planctomycetota bacterium]|nr:glycosyltransferase family 39 protein [Planctomycetota bacterium]